MAKATDESDPPLSPDNAFSLLGNETRMEILQVLGNAEEPLSFSRLREQVGMGNSGQFSYHLNQLAGHFVRTSEDGYELNIAGLRVIEAVLSGAVTENPAIGPTQIDLQCPRCDAPVKISYQGDWVALSCTECSGTYKDDHRDLHQTIIPDEMLGAGYLGGVALPPAGIPGRSPIEVFRAAELWGTLEQLAVAEDLCPRCSANLETSVDVCENHDMSAGLCEACGNRNSVTLDSSCPNCPYTMAGEVLIYLHSNTDLIAFEAARGYNPLTPHDLFAAREVNEEIVSENPFTARYTFTIDEDSISLTIDADLNVVDIDC